MGINTLQSLNDGGIVKAIQEGKWILLDEINLAASETLQRLTSILASLT